MEVTENLCREKDNTFKINIHFCIFAVYASYGFQ